MALMQLRSPQLVVNFAQTHRDNVRQIRRITGAIAERIAATPMKPTFKDYARYAMYCLELVPTSQDQDILDLNRQMAVEWIRLAEAALHP
jgi:hypothetical protein